MTVGVADINFGDGGNAAAWQIDGWSMPERGFTWSVGDKSQLRLPTFAAAAAHGLEITLSPHHHAPAVARQGLRIAVNGKVLAEDFLAGETTLGVDIPAGLCSEGAVLTLHHPGAFSPAAHGVSTDGRRLGVAVSSVRLFAAPARPASVPVFMKPLPMGAEGRWRDAVRGMTALAPAVLAAKFESLGQSCELGAVQRELGAEPLGLLRFAGVTPPALVQALDAGFAGIDAESNLHLAPRGGLATGCWDARDATYGITFHSPMRADQVPVAQARASFARYLRVLRRKLLEDLAEGHKIFVFQTRRAVSVAQARPVQRAIRRHGPGCLLFVSETRDLPPGSVALVEAGLLHGAIDRLAADLSREPPSILPWISILANAYRVWRADGGGAD